MQPVIRRVIDKICCDKMQGMLDKKRITHHVLTGSINGHNAWNFYLGDTVIFHCPWCGESCY